MRINGCFCGLLIVNFFTITYFSQNDCHIKVFKKKSAEVNINQNEDPGSCVNNAKQCEPMIQHLKID